jgi:hypothetical protein
MLRVMDDEVDLAELAAVCEAVLACYDRLLRDDHAVPAPTGPEVDRALAGAQGLPGMPGRVWWALDLVGRGASGATPAELAVAIEVLRAVATGRAPAKPGVARL